MDDRTMIGRVSREKNIVDKVKKQDKKISIAIMSSFAILTIQYFILYYFNLTETGIGSMIQLLSKGLVGLFFVIALPAVLRRNWLLLISIYLGTAGMFLYNYLLFPQNTELLTSNIFPLFFTCIPSFVYSYSIKDKKVLMDIMEKVSSIVFIVGTLIGILVFTNKMSVGSYSMSLSYYMLLPAMVNLYNLLEHKSMGSLLVSVISLTVILALGSRGAIMCVGAFIILYLINNRMKFTYRSIIINIIILIVFVMGFIYFNEILIYMHQLLGNYGIQSRTLDLFMQKGLHLSGRDNLYKSAIYKIKEHPFLGIGITGDRLYIGQYSHNIIIEIILSFGVVLGSIILMWVGWVTYKSISVKTKYESNIIIIWFSIGMIHLMVSSTYLTDFKFWIFLGLALKTIKDNKSQPLN